MADNYLNQVAKARNREAVREAKGEGTAQLLDHLKKGEMATEAERLLKGSGWLPEILRRGDLVVLDGDGAAEEQGALREEALGAAHIDVEIDLPAFLTTDLPVESTAMMAAE
jgi:ParB family transcriptional regulator, chromosome partitioning protein